MVKKLINSNLEERGLSLIEVIISIAILGILSVPIFGLLNMNLKLNIQSRDKFIATNLAESEIEELKFVDNKETGEETQYKDGFVINSIKELVDRKDIDKDDEEQIIWLKDLYKLKVEVKKDGKVIETIFTYKNSLEGSDFN